MHKLSNFWLIITILVVCVACIGAAFYLFRQKTPDYVYSANHYAFVSDELSDRLVVVNLDKQEQVGRYDLGLKPDLLTIATDSPMMAYANFMKHKLFFFNLKNGRQQSIELPSLPIAIFFIPNQQDLLVIMQDEIALADPIRSALYALPKPAGVMKFSQVMNPVLSVIDNSVWLNEPSQNRIYRLLLNQQRNSTWEHFDIDIPVPLEIGPLEVNAQGTLLAFSDKDSHHGYLYELAHKRLKQVIDFKINKETKAKSIRPYIDNNSEQVVFANDQGQLVAFDLATEQQFTQMVPMSTKLIRGAWLNQLWPVLSSKGLAIVPSSRFSELNRQSIPPMSWIGLPGVSKDLWVTGDGKTALLTSQSSSQKLIMIDVRTRRQQEIELKDILNVNLVRMGGNNSFCY